MKAHDLAALLYQLPPDTDIFIYNTYWVEPVPIEPRIIVEDWTDHKHCITEQIEH